MRDDGIDEDPEEFPPDDPLSKLERLEDGFDDLGAPDEQPAPLSRREIDELVEQVLAEELARLEGETVKK